MMNILRSKKFLLVGGLALFLIVLLFTIQLATRSQETRSQATRGSKLSFYPVTTIFLPVRKQLGEQVSFDLMVDPGTNALSFVKFEVIYPADVLRMDDQSGVVLNNDIFPITMEGPVLTPGKIAATVSIGNDATRAITSLAKVATLTFVTTSVTDTSVEIRFNATSEALSVASSDQASENVLATAESAYILIEPIALTPLPSSTPRPTITRAPSVTPIVTQTPTKTSYTVALHGIGAAGDNTNPTGNEFSNKNPKHTMRDVILTIFDASDKQIASLPGIMTYNQQTGVFKGETQTTMQSPIPKGDYTVAVYTKGFLRNRLPNVIALGGSSSAVLAEVHLVTGDVDSDNRLTILDYNQITDCYSDLSPARNCVDIVKKERTDINDDGSVNQFDYNLFLRELKVQPGI